MSRSITRGAALFAAAATLTLPLTFVPAYAAAPSCAGSTPDGEEIVEGICQVIFDEAGSYTLKLPKNLKRVAAVIAGGGGGGAASTVTSGVGTWSFGGGGGEVLWIEKLTSGTTSVSVTIGAGGVGRQNGTAADSGTSTSITYKGTTKTAPGGGGASTTQGGSSGVFQGAGGSNGGGAGAGGDADMSTGGLGVEAIFDTDPTDLFGEDTYYDSDYDSPIGPGGFGDTGGDANNNSIFVAAGGNAIMNEASPGEDRAGDGVDGIAIFRWSLTTSDEDPDGGGLPETGAPMAPWAVVGGLAAAAGGAVALTARKRRSAN